jgi:hypothetical protein
MGLLRVMLERLELRDVGTAPAMSLSLSPRLNLIAGDNGLGKTFLLDVAWWALTYEWASDEATPHRGEGAKPTMTWAVRGEPEPREIVATYDFAEGGWSRSKKHDGVDRRRTPVFYARVDGGFSVWDPLRISGKWRRPLGMQAMGMSSAFQLTRDQVWNGLSAEDGTTLCNGLVRDWATWQLQRGSAFDTLTRVLQTLSPNPEEAIRPGAATTRISIHDVRDIPTIDLPYGTIPVVHASAGMKRILALSYLLVWMWREHVEAAKLKNQAPSTSLVLLFDEVEAHLHPQWQRVIVPALLRVVRELSPDIEVQILATTHAPLVLASLEPHFDDTKDALFHLDLVGREVTAAKVPWRARGDASAWLTSEVFELGEARSREAEAAIEGAKQAMLKPGLTIDDARRIHHDLHAVLKDTDPFWPRWLLRAKQAGVEP